MNTKGMAWVLTMVMLFVCAPPALTSHAADGKYNIEVLQVTDVRPFKLCFDGFMQELARNGLVQGKNLTVRRTVIDFDVEKGGVWSKMGVLLRIKSEAQRIAGAKPDLVLTIGTPVTKYAKDTIISAGIPVVFASVAIPQSAGCRSLVEAGKGFTGATLYMNVKDALKIVKLAFPRTTTYGIIHTDDENAVAHTEEARKHGPSLGIQIVSKQVSKSDPITPAAEELMSKGAKGFIVPLDTYYGIKNEKAARDMGEISRKTKFPVVSFILYKTPGAVFYVGSDFGLNGAMAARQAIKILKEGARPESLPILKQEDLMILVDENQLKAIGVELPMEILKLAKPL
jgi:putative ABC transport system substrate-binding protein